MKYISFFVRNVYATNVVDGDIILTSLSLETLINLNSNDQKYNFQMTFSSNVQLHMHFVSKFINKYKYSNSSHFVTRYSAIPISGPATRHCYPRLITMYESCSS